MDIASLRRFYHSHRTALVMAVVALATFAVFAYRRPDQLLHPYLWVEDGPVNFEGYIASGWRIIFFTQTGYFALPTKAIFVLAISASVRWLPEILYWLNLAFSIGVLLAVALSPIRPKNRLACALAVLVVPIGPEIYAVSEYAFWWGTILCLLPLLWRDNGGKTILRSALLVVGGLSSPLIIALIPLYALRAFLSRRGPGEPVASSMSATRGRWEPLEFRLMATTPRNAALGDFFLCLTTSAIQAGALLTHPMTSVARWSDFSIPLIVEKFFGWFVFLPTNAITNQLDTLSYSIGLAFFAVVALILAIHRRELGLPCFLLCACCLLSIISSISRTPVSLMHPASAGPRYFFIPFVCLSWLLIQIASTQTRLAKWFGASTLAIALLNGIPMAQRRHDTIDWRAQLDMCAKSATNHVFPIHYDGDARQTWTSTDRGSDCRRLIQQSWFDNRLR